jgi:hypothetical protein
MGDGIGQALAIVIAVAINAALAWATNRVYSRAGFPGAWFVAPRAFYSRSSAFSRSCYTWPSRTGRRSRRRRAFPAPRSEVGCQGPGGCLPSAVRLISRLHLVPLLIASE